LGSDIFKENVILDGDSASMIPLGNEIINHWVTSDFEKCVQLVCKFSVGELAVQEAMAIKTERDFH